MIMNHKEKKLSNLNINLDAKLGAAPLSALGIVPNFVVGAHADPVRNRAVLALLLRQLLLRAEGFVGRHLFIIKQRKRGEGGEENGVSLFSCERKINDMQTEKRSGEEDVGMSRLKRVGSRRGRVAISYEVSGRWNVGVEGGPGKGDETGRACTETQNRGGGKKIWGLRMFMGFGRTFKGSASGMGDTASMAGTLSPQLPTCFRARSKNRTIRQALFIHHHRLQRWHCAPAMSRFSETRP